MAGRLTGPLLFVGAGYHALWMLAWMPLSYAFVMDEFGRPDIGQSVLAGYAALPSVTSIPERAFAILIFLGPLALLAQFVGGTLSRRSGELSPTTWARRGMVYLYWTCWIGLFVHGAYTMNHIGASIPVVLALYLTIALPVVGLGISMLPVLDFLRVRAERRTSLGAFQ